MSSGGYDSFGYGICVNPFSFGVIATWYAYKYEFSIHQRIRVKSSILWKESFVGGWIYRVSNPKIPKEHASPIEQKKGKLICSGITIKFLSLSS